MDPDRAGHHAVLDTLLVAADVDDHAALPNGSVGLGAAPAGEAGCGRPSTISVDRRHLTRRPSCQRLQRRLGARPLRMHARFATVTSITVDGTPGSSPPSTSRPAAIGSRRHLVERAPGRAPPRVLALRRSASRRARRRATRQPRRDAERARRSVCGEPPQRWAKLSAGLGTISVTGPGKQRAAIGCARPVSSGSDAQRTLSEPSITAVGWSSGRCFRLYSRAQASGARRRPRCRTRVSVGSSASAPASMRDAASAGSVSATSPTRSARCRRRSLSTPASAYPTRSRLRCQRRRLAGAALERQVNPPGPAAGRPEAAAVVHLEALAPAHRREPRLVLGHLRLQRRHSGSET